MWWRKISRQFLLLCWCVLWYLPTAQASFTSVEVTRFASVSSPYAVWVDTLTNMLYVGSSGNPSHLYRGSVTAGSVTNIAGGSNTATYITSSTVGSMVYFYAISGIAGDTNGNLYFTDDGNNNYCAVWKYTASSGVYQIVAGYTANLAACGATPDGSPATSSEIYHPWGIAVDTAGTMYFSEWGSDVIRTITSSNTLKTIAGSLSQGGHRDGPATAALLYTPRGIFIDSQSNMYIADYINVVIRKLSLSTGIISTYAGIAGSRGSTGDGGPATSAEIQPPFGITGSTDGSIYVSFYSYDYRIRQITAAGIISTIIGDGANSPANENNVGGTSAQIGAVYDLSIDSNSNLYIADYANSYILYGYNNHPSVAPTSPTSQPSTYPSEQPSILPSSQPVAHPSGQPSTQPSNQPSEQPVMLPSGQPSTQPSSQPSNQPNNRPSVQPSSQPSVQSSKTPSTQPSLQPSTQPSSWPSGRPSRQPSDQPSSQPGDRPSDQPSRNPSNQPSKTPSLQPLSRPSAQPSSGPSNQPSAVPSEQPSSQPIRKPSGQPTTQPNALPTTQPSQQPIKGPTGQPSRCPSVQPSVEPSTQPSSQPSGQPRTLPTAQPSNKPSCQPAVEPSVQPSTVPSSQPVTGPSTQPTIQPLDQPSSQPSQQSSSQPTFSPSVQPSQCPSARPSRQPSEEPSNQPSEYPSSQPSSQPSARPSSLPTCQPSTLPSTQSSAQPSTVPSSQPSVDPSQQPKLCPSAQPSNQPSLDPSSSHPSAQLTNPREGYPNTESVSIASAIVSTDGLSMVITLTAPISLVPSSFASCQDLVLFSCASSFACTLITSTQIETKMISKCVTLIGSRISLAQNISRYIAVDTLLVIDDVNIVIEAPLHPQQPVVSILANGVIGACSNMILDLSRTTGSLGQAWQTINVTVASSSSGAHNDEENVMVSSYIVQHFSTSLPITVPDNLLHSDVVYEVEIVLCNLLKGCGQANVTVNVTSFQSTVPPFVTILGPNTLISFANATLSLPAYAYVSSCNGYLRTSGLSYEWSVVKYDSNSSAVELTDLSKDPSQLLLPAYSLTAGQRYLVQVTVTDLLSSYRVTASIQIEVLVSPLVVVLIPGLPQLLQLGQELLIDASQSYDPDQLNAVLNFTWTCFRDDLQAENCPLSLSAAANDWSGAHISTSNQTLLNASFTVVVTISCLTEEMVTKKANSSLEVKVVASGAPIVQILTSPSILTDVVVNRQLSIQGSVLFSSNSNGLSSDVAVWSSISNHSLLTCALTSLQTKVYSHILTSVSLYLAAGCLQGGMTYLFTLTCGKSSASVTVTTSLPPFAGSLVVSPNEGTELNTTFTMSTSGWIDDGDHLPLTYQFGFVSPQSLHLISYVQSATLLPYTYTILPGGDRSMNYSLNATVRVVDALGSQTETSTAVMVSPLGDISQVLSLLRSFALINASTAYLQQVISTVATAFNLQVNQNVTQQQQGRALLLAAQAQLLSQQNAGVMDIITNGNSLSYIIPNSQYLSADDVLQAASLSSQILQQALSSSSSLSAVQVANALIPLNAVLEYAINITAAVSYSQATTSIGSVVNGVNLFLELLAAQSIPSAPAVSYVLSEFKLASVSYHANGDTPPTLTSPQSKASFALVQNDSSATNVASLQLTEYVSPSWINIQATPLYSSILTAKVTISSASDDNVLVVSLPYAENEATDSVQLLAESTEVHCLPSIATGIYFFTCPHNSSAKIAYHCAGGSSFSKYVIFCPYHTLSCANIDLSTQTVAKSTCITLNISEGILTCQCISTNNDSSATSSRVRRLTTSSPDADTVSSSALTVAAITAYVGEDFAATLAASASFDASTTVTKSIAVIAMFSSLWGSGLLLLLFVSYYKYRYAGTTFSNPKSTSTKISPMSLHNRATSIHKKNHADELAFYRLLMRYCRAVVPKIYDSSPFLLRAKDEMLRHHLYISTLLGQDSHRFPALSMLQILTIQTTLMFLMALLYDLQAPDNDGSCSAYLTEDHCLQRRSILDHRVTYCEWRLAASHLQLGDDDISSYSDCSYRQPVFSFKVALYCAVVISLFSALFIRPLEYCFLYLLSQNQEAAPGNHRQSAHVWSSLLQRQARAVGRRVTAVARRASTFLNKSLQRLIKTRFIPQETILSHAEVIQVINNTNSNNENLIGNSSQRDMSNLSRLIHTIKCNSGDNIGSHNNAVDYNTTIEVMKTQITQQCALLSPGEERDRIKASWKDLLTDEHDVDSKRVLIRRMQWADRTAEEAMERFVTRSDEEAGLEIMRMFLMDLLGVEQLGVAGQIFSTKFNLDYTTMPKTSARGKLGMWCVIVGMNVFFIYYTLLKGYRRGIGWQHCYLIACITQLLAEILLFETLECCWIHLFVPGLVYYEVKPAKRQVAHALREAAKLMSRSYHKHPTQRQQDGEEHMINNNDDVEANHQAVVVEAAEPLSYASDKPVFNAAQYFFASHKLAQRFPRPLLESMIVLSYQTYYTSADKVGASKRNHVLSASLSSVMYAVAISVAILPSEMQRALIRFFEPFLFGSLIVAYELFLHDHVAWIITVVLFGLMLALLVFLLYKAWHNHNSSSEVDKTSAVTDIASQTTRSARHNNRASARQRSGRAKRSTTLRHLHQRPAATTKVSHKKLAVVADLHALETDVDQHHGERDVEEDGHDVKPTEDTALQSQLEGRGINRGGELGANIPMHEDEFFYLSDEDDEVDNNKVMRTAERVDDVQHSEDEDSEDEEDEEEEDEEAAEADGLSEWSWKQD